MTAVSRWLKGLGALFVLACLLGGIPWGLVTQVGWPLPTFVPSWGVIWTSLQSSYVPDVLIVKTLAVVVWVAWLQVVLSMAAQFVAIARGGMVRRLRGIGPMQALTGSLLAAVLTLSLQAKVTAPQPRLTFELSVDAVLNGQAPLTPTTAAAEAPAKGESYTVVRRDNLWSIAASKLGDPHRWPEIFELNKNKMQPDGQTLTMPELIRPGWVLQLPANTVLTSNTASSKGLTSSALAATVPDEQVSSDAPAKGNPAAALQSVSTAPDTQADAVQPATTTTTVAATETTSAPGVVREDDVLKNVALASGSIVSLTLAIGVGGALSLLRQRRRRSYQPSMPESDIVYVDPSIDADLRRLRQADLENGGPVDTEQFSEHPLGPGEVPMGWDEHGEVVIDLTQQGIVRPSSIEAARSVVVSHLADYTFVDAEVLFAGVELARDLIGDVEPFAGLRIELDDASVLRVLEAELVARKRLAEQVEVGTLSEMRDQAPEAVPAVLIAVFKNATDQAMAQLRSIVDQGKQLGITALVLSDADVENAEDHSFGLNVNEVRRMLGTVGESRRWEDKPAAIVDVPVEPISEPTELSVSDSHDEQALKPPVRISVFGMPRIEVNGVEVQGKLRAKAVELLVFLALRPKGAGMEVIGAALWPDAAPKQMAERFSTVLSALRRVLRREAELKDAWFVDRSNVYFLDPVLVSVDFWDYAQAIDRFRSCASDVDRQRALEDVIALYSDHLGGDTISEWMDDSREHLRRRVLDCMMQLVDLHERTGGGGAEAAIDVLERAIELDPIAEELYQRVMALQIELGRYDAVMRTSRLLQDRLEALELGPSAESEALAGQARAVVQRERQIERAREQRKRAS